MGLVVFSDGLCCVSDCLWFSGSLWGFRLLLPFGSGRLKLAFVGCVPQGTHAVWWCCRPLLGHFCQLRAWQSHTPYGLLPVAVIPAQAGLLFGLQVALPALQAV